MCVYFILYKSSWWLCSLTNVLHYSFYFIWHNNINIFLPSTSTSNVPIYISFSPSNSRSLISWINTVWMYVYTHLCIFFPTYYLLSPGNATFKYSFPSSPLDTGQPIGVLFPGGDNPASCSYISSVVCNFFFNFVLLILWQIYFWCIIYLFIHISNAVPLLILPGRVPPSISPPLIPWDDVDHLQYPHIWAHQISTWLGTFFSHWSQTR